MPITSVYEHHGLVSREYQIRATWKAFVMEPIADTQFV
jgi:hypothetical protein